jgi:hypothetical protein
MFIRDLNDLRDRVKLFFVRIPKSLLDILGFGESATAGELQEYIKKATKLLIEDQERHEKMKLQKEYKLPIHPNQSWHELKAKIRIIELKKKKENEAQGKKDDDEFLKRGNNEEEV